MSTEAQKLPTASSPLREASMTGELKVVAWRLPTGHGVHFRETITTELERLEWEGNKMWQALCDHAEAQQALQALREEVEGLRERVAFHVAMTREAQDLAGLYSKDTERLSFLDAECYSLNCESGSEDDVHWSVVSHHMRAPHERVESSANSPREAIDTALAATRKTDDGGEG